MFLGLYVKGKTLAWSAKDAIVDRVRNEDGAVATEYGLLLVLIAIAIVAAATALGLAIAGVFTRGTNSLNAGAGS